MVRKTEKKHMRKIIEMVDIQNLVTHRFLDNKIQFVPFGF